MKMLKKYILLAVMAVLTVTCLTGCGSKKIDVMYDMTVKFSGINGEGYATYDFENTEMGFIQALVNSGDEKMESFGDLSRLDAIAGTVDFKVEPKEGLSNGDKVTLTATVDSKALKELGYSAKTTSKTFTVEGLEVPVEIDPFKDFEISFSGVSPDARAEFQSSREVDGVTVQYRCENSSNLRLGGTALITASTSDPKRFILTEETKEFPVEGVESYILHADDIPDEILDEMRAQAEGRWKNYKFHYDYEGWTYESFDLIGYEFWVRKEEKTVEMPNNCYLLYEVTVNNGEEDFSFFHFYQFENLIVKEDGSWDVGTPWFGSNAPKFEHNGVALKGFESLNEMKEFIASEQEDTYYLETDYSK